MAESFDKLDSIISGKVAVLLWPYTCGSRTTLRVLTVPFSARKAIDWSIPPPCVPM